MILISMMDNDLLLSMWNCFDRTNMTQILDVLLLFTRLEVSVLHGPRPAQYEHPLCLVPDGDGEAGPAAVVSVPRRQPRDLRDDHLLSHTQGLE